MPRTSTEQIKEDEKKVIKQLLEDSSRSVAKIAKKCGFSRQKVWRIVKRLEKKRTIWGYSAVVEEEELGVKSYVLLIKLTTLPITRQAVDKIIKGFLYREGAKIGVDVSCSFYLNGFYDWMLCFTAQDIKQAKKFCNALNSGYQGYVAELHLLEKIFPVKQCGFVNPRVKRLKEFLWFPPAKKKKPLKKKS